MMPSSRPSRCPPATRWSPRRTLPWAAVLVYCAVASGCAAISNPVANGIPVDRLPPELLAESKEGMQTIPLSLLRQKPPTAYQLGPGDVLGIWIEGVLGEKGQPPPTRLPDVGNQPSITEKRSCRMSANQKAGIAMPRNESVVAE